MPPGGRTAPPTVPTPRTPAGRSRRPLVEIGSVIVGIVDVVESIKAEALVVPTSAIGVGVIVVVLVVI